MILAMFRIMLAALVSLTATSAQAAERGFTVSGFEKVQVEGPFQVSLTTGSGSHATASGSPQALDRVSVQVEGRTLRIRPNRSAWGAAPAPGEGGVRIVLATHELSSAVVAGSGSLVIDKVKAMRFDAALSGSGRIAIGNVEADKLNLQAMGSGALQIAGRVKTLAATVSGQAGLSAAGLIADDADLKADTTGAITFGVRRAAKVNATGAGDVIVTGTPACTVIASGVGLVRCGH
jgi:hypothetical protein